MKPSWEDALTGLDWAILRASCLPRSVHLPCTWVGEPTSLSLVSALAARCPADQSPAGPSAALPCAWFVTRPSECGPRRHRSDEFAEGHCRKLVMITAPRSDLAWPPSRGGPHGPLLHVHPLLAGVPSGVFLLPSYLAGASGLCPASSFTRNESLPSHPTLPSPLTLEISSASINEWGPSIYFLNNLPKPRLRSRYHSLA